MNMNQSGAQGLKAWPGGKASLAITAVGYPCAVTFEIVSGFNEVPVNSTAIQANGTWSPDLPEGQYRTRFHSEWQTVLGDRYRLLVRADQYPDSLDLEMLGPDGNAVALNSANINGRLSQDFDLSFGRYRMSASGSAHDLSAMLVRHG